MMTGNIDLNLYRTNADVMIELGNIPPFLIRGLLWLEELYLNDNKLSGTIIFCFATSCNSSYELKGTSVYLHLITWSLLMSVIIISQVHFSMMTMI